LPSEMPDMAFERGATIAFDAIKRARAPCRWHDRDAADTARSYARTFPDSSLGVVYLAPGDFPPGKQGDVLTIEFRMMGMSCLGLIGGPAFRHNEAFSFQVATADMACGGT